MDGIVVGDVNLHCHEREEVRGVVIVHAELEEEGVRTNLARHAYQLKGSVFSTSSVRTALET